jgi:hydrogenase nickel incorporation protein HypA/HybF
MRIGALSGVVVDAFEFAFGALSEGTIAEGARLSIEATPILCYCPSCNIEFEVRDFQYACPRCTSTDCEIRQGREMNLVSLEVS